MLITDPAAAYTPFTLPVTYKDDRIPERLFIGVFSSEEQATDGTYIIVDNFMVNEGVAAVAEVKTEISAAIFPVPASNKITIETEEEITSVRFLNSIGDVVIVTSVAGSYDISSLLPGVYFAEISTSNGIVRKKFLKR